MTGVSVPCEACGKPVRGGDEFCEACGAKVSDALKSALRERLEASDFVYADHAKKLKNARTTIAAISVLFVIGGIVFFFITRGQANDALMNLRGANASDPLLNPIAGATTVGELRSVLEREPWQVLGLNFFLASVMLGLWIWSKRALLPAIITALGIYVAVIVANALYDPTTIAQGIIVKVIVIAALAHGIRSTLAARKLEAAR